MCYVISRIAIEDCERRVSVKKKFFLLSLIAVLALALGACRKKVTAKSVEDLVWDDEKKEYVNEEDAKLVLWVDNEDFAKKVIELWEKKYPDVPLDWEEVGPVDVPEKLKNDGPAGLGGDVFYFPHDHIPGLRSQRLLFEFHSRDKDEFTNRMVDVAVDVTLHDGKMYAVPSSIENIAFLYNKQITEQLPVCETTFDTEAENLREQLEAKEIYLEELFACVADWGNSYKGAGVTLTDAADRFENVENGVISDAEDKHTILAWQLYDSYHNYPFLTKHGYRVFGDDNDDYKKFNIHTEQVKKALEDITGTWYGNKDDSKLFPGLASIEDLNWDHSVARFQKGQVAMTFTGPWVMGDMINTYLPEWIEDEKMGVTEDTELSDIIGVLEIPKFDNDVTPVTFSGVQVLGMNIFTEYPNAAMNLVRFLSSDEVMAVVYETWGKIPAITDTSKVPGLQDDKLSQGFLKQAEYAHAMPVIAEVDYMWDPLRDVWTYIFDEKMTIEQAQQRAHEDYQRLLSDAGVDY